MASAASVRAASISRANTTKVAKRRDVSNCEKCCALTIADFVGNRRVARTMNPLLAVGSDAELAHGFEPFDDLDKIPLTRRFRPFS